jgi:hypothetical protein
MPAPRLPFARSLVRCSLVVSAIAAGVWGCQGPDAFFRSGDGAINGSGGAHGQLGGTTGGGTGGVLGGTGGKATGGAPGTGGARGLGGMVTSMGGRGMGGMTASMGGMTTSLGGMTTSSGGATGSGGDSGSGGAPGGTGPCMGLCDNPIVFTTASYNSTNLGTGATCHETTANIQGGGCSNCTGRTFTINGTPETGTGNWPTPLPAKVNGGYCFQATAGGLTYATFYTF